MTSHGTEFGLFRDVNTSWLVSSVTRTGQEAWEGDIETGSSQSTRVLVSLAKESDFILSQCKGIEGFYEAEGMEQKVVCVT